MPRATRLAVYERDQGVCQLCHGQVDMQAPPGSLMAPTVDHIVPQSWTLVPDHSEANLRLAHMICNAKRGAAAA